MLYKVGTRDYAKFMRKDARQKQMALVVINENRNDITNLIKISKANRVYCYAYYELKQRVISKFFMDTSSCSRIARFRIYNNII